MKDRLQRKAYLRGLRVEKFINRICIDTDSINGDNYKDAFHERHVLLFDIETRISNGQIVRIQHNTMTFWEEIAPCSSGWMTGTTIHCDLNPDSKFGGYTHSTTVSEIIFTRTKRIPTDLSEFALKDFCRESTSFQILNEKGDVILDFNRYGGDEYYPSGHYSINMDLFTPTPRARKKHPIYLFKGNSAIGKSYLAHELERSKIYETDSSNTLPQKIICDVIVFGNRKKDFTIDEIAKRIPEEAELIVVDFSYYDKLKNRKSFPASLREKWNQSDLTMSNNTGSIAVNSIILNFISDLYCSFEEIHPEAKEFIIPDGYDLKEVEITILNYLSGKEVNEHIAEMLQLK